MPTKRKSDTLDDKENASDIVKRARVEEERGASASSSKMKTSKATKPQDASWRDIVLEGEDEGEVPIYDDCNTIRRKIRALQKTPGFKVTHWLKEIGNINSNSYGRFMTLKGPTGGAENGTYYAAYVYFEKVRVFEGKKKTATRIAAEQSGPFSRARQSRYVWVFTG
ncbi:hypothetical protein FRC04_012021 [Tulasnella sp. 424]|nr:hypothetical protein FRC04_012021 [Tulasnella sp. 424]KAG8971261.1 hypothetical protein FRC05_011360 [Tulasnella sp. 425]